MLNVESYYNSVISHDYFVYSNKLLGCVCLLISWSLAYMFSLVFVGLWHHDYHNVTQDVTNELGMH